MADVKSWLERYDFHALANSWMGTVPDLAALLPFLFVCITIATVIFWVLERKCQARAMGSWEETVI